MKINHNISALKANNTLGRTGIALDKSMERLSSGYRINHAADDAAGLAISNKMKTQIRGLEQASRNAADGVSVIQTAEGALNEVTAMLQRMRELAVQAANGTNTAEDRAAIQNEIDQLNGEIDRISECTEFNTKTLLDGNVDRKSYSNTTMLELISLSDTVIATDFSLEITRDARQAVIAGFGWDPDPMAEIGASGKININGMDIIINAEQTYMTVFENLRNACDSMNINIFPGESGGEDPEYAYYDIVPLDGSSELVLVSKGYGSNEKIEMYCNSEELRAIFGMGDEYKVTARGVDANAVLIDGFSPTATVSASGDIITVTDRNDFKVQFRATPGAAGTTFIDADVNGTEQDYDDSSSLEDVMVTVLGAGPIDLQIGANEGQTVEVRIPRVDSLTLGVRYVNVCTDEGAQHAITLADKAVNEVSAIRSKLGAYQNRLDHAIANLDVSAENITESLSRIEDTDMAKEMTNFTQKNVLSQAGTAMLAQANERPQTILSLLQA